MIRLYRPEDRAEVMDVWERASAVAHPFLAPEFLERERRAIPELYLPKAETWVRESGGHVVGFVSLLGNEIGGLFVDPRHHRSGIGRALVERARDQRGALEVEVFEKNAMGRAFYEALGFEFVGRRIDDDAGFPVLRLRLTARGPSPDSDRPEEVGGRVRIRPEEPADAGAVRAVNEAAFAGSAEADIVERVRRDPGPVLSLVAETDGRVVGHILFSPVSVTGNPEIRWMGLGPMAVLPARQRRGIGSALVREGLQRCRDLARDAVVVLGHPEYYPRFGFVPASRFGITSEYDVPDGAFMAVELRPGALRGRSGRVIYHDAFRTG